MTTPPKVREDTHFASGLGLIQTVAAAAAPVSPRTGSSPLRADCTKAAAAPRIRVITRASGAWRLFVAITSLITRRCERAAAVWLPCVSALRCKRADSEDGRGKGGRVKERDTSDFDMNPEAKPRIKCARACYCCDRERSPIHVC